MPITKKELIDVICMAKCNSSPCPNEIQESCSAMNTIQYAKKRDLLTKPKKDWYVKSKSAVINELKNAGYKERCTGDWIKPGRVTFVADMFNYCGMKLVPYASELYHFDFLWIELREEEE